MAYKAARFKLFQAKYKKHSACIWLNLVVTL